MSRLSVKLFIKKAGSTDEFDIRRFSVDEDVCTSYDYLVAKIHATIGTAPGTAIRLFWKGNNAALNISARPAEGPWGL